MNKEALIDKVIQAGYTTAVIEEHVSPDKAPAQKELWLIAEPRTLLDPEKKNFALIKILKDTGIAYSEITTYARSIIARGIKLSAVAAIGDRGP